MFIIQIRINNKVIIRPRERIGMKKKLLEMTKEELRRLFRMAGRFRRGKRRIN